MGGPLLTEEPAGQVIPTGTIAGDLDPTAWRRTDVTNDAPQRHARWEVFLRRTAGFGLPLDAANVPPREVPSSARDVATATVLAVDAASSSPGQGRDEALSSVVDIEPATPSSLPQPGGRGSPGSRSMARGGRLGP